MATLGHLYLSVEETSFLEQSLSADQERSCPIWAQSRNYSHLHMSTRWRDSLMRQSFRSCPSDDGPWTKDRSEAVGAQVLVSVPQVAGTAC